MGKSTSQAFWNHKLKAMGLGVDAGRLPAGKGPRARKCIFTPRRGQQAAAFTGSRADARELTKAARQRDRRGRT